MRLSKLTLLLVAAAATLLFAGCASHTSNGKNHTVILGGLFEYHQGAYEKQTPNNIPLNSEKPEPGSRLTGNKTSILWGLFSYRDQ